MWIWGSPVRAGAAVPAKSKTYPQNCLICVPRKSQTERQRNVNRWPSFPRGKHERRRRRHRAGGLSPWKTMNAPYQIAREIVQGVGVGAIRRKRRSTYADLALAAHPGPDRYRYRHIACDYERPWLFRNLQPAGRPVRGGRNWVRSRPWHSCHAVCFQRLCPEGAKARSLAGHWILGRVLYLDNCLICNMVAAYSRDDLGPTGRAALFNPRGVQGLEPKPRP